MSATNEPEDGGPRSLFPIVGIGASAGGLKAAETLLENASVDGGMAYVLVFHLDPKHKSEAAELLQRHTRMPVAQITGPTLLRRDHVYVVPPGHGLSLRDGAVTLTRLARTDGHPTVIDRFFRALAEHAGEHAIGVVLSGTGAEGSQGLKAIKEAGGVTVAQEEEDAKFPGMPHNAIATGLVDFVLPAARISAKLAEIGKFAVGFHRSLSERGGSEKVADTLQKIFVQLRTRVGHDFSHYKPSTVMRRISRRMQMCAVPGLAAYLDLLRTQPAEADALLHDLLISVTSFFRDPDAMEVLAREVVPALCKRAGGQTLRVWIPGCATGEEAYTLAMLLTEGCDGLVEPPRLQIFASDVNDRALDVARRGAYPDAIAGDVSPARLQRFFTHGDDGYVVKAALREQILFTRQDLLQDPPFARLDLISCRNLLIYLKSDVQAHVFALFRFALKPRGYLFLGTSESLGESAKLFAEVDHKAKLFQVRRAPAGGVPVPLAPVGPLRGTGRQRECDEPAKRFADVARDALLNSYVPPCVIVDERNDVAYISGRVGKYLEPASGATNYNILDMARDVLLRRELRGALYKVFHEDAEVLAKPVRLCVDGRDDWVKITVRRLPETDDYALVMFEEADAAAPPTSAPPEGDIDQIAQLESELAHTRESLQTTIEELETSNEELRASNEELQSVNEELQSTLEELETGKEELQSTNEELLTVNSELQTRNDDLARANSDLENLIASTDIGTLFLDDGLRVRRYTPRMTDIYNLIASDVGRPLAHITHRLESGNLVADATHVLQNLVSVERELASTDGHFYQTRLRPYRTADNKVGGVVLTFVDVTERGRAQELLRLREEQKAYLLRLSDNIRPVLDAHQKIVVAMRLLAHQLGVDRAVYLEVDSAAEFATVVGGYARDLPELHGRVRLTNFSSGLRQNYVAGKTFAISDSATQQLGKLERATLEKLGIRALVGVPNVKGGKLKALLTVSHHEPRAWLSNELELIEETAERTWAAVQRAHAEKALAQSERKYRELFETMDEGFCIIQKCADAEGAVDFRWVEYNAAFVAITGLSDPIGKSMRARFPAEVLPVIEIYDKVLRTGEPANFERPMSNSNRIIDAHAFRLGEADSGQVAVVFQDVTGRAEAEQRQKLLINELNHRVKNNLTIVQALAAQTFQGVESKAALATFQARLVALSNVHDVLTRESWNGADVGNVVRGALAAWIGGTDARIRIEGGRLRLRSAATLALGLALHELATNASKYGALSNDHGVVELNWVVPRNPSGLFRMHWCERGGPPVHVPSRRGFGSWLIETGLAQDLRGEVRLDFAPEGVTCIIEARVAEIRDGRRERAG